MLDTLFGRIVRNFKSSKGTPFMPVLSCRKNTGPLLVSFMAKAIIPPSQLNTNSISPKESTTSMTLMAKSEYVFLARRFFCAGVVFMVDNVNAKKTPMVGFTKAFRIASKGTG